MFDPFSREDHDLNTAIASAYTDLARYDANSEEYAAIVHRLTQLYALKNQQDQLNLNAQQTHAAHQLACDQNAWQEEQDQRPFYQRIEPSVALTVAGNLAVALIVVKYEQTGVITTKVVSLLKKL